MPTLRVPGAELHYDEQGCGPGTVVFAHSLLLSGRMFDEQVRLLRDRFRCIRFDFRGQGQSEITRSGYDMDTLSQDAVELIGALDCAPCHFVGHSMGGFIGLRLAARRPERLRSLVLVNTSADPEPRENVARYRVLNFVARWFGLQLVAGRIVPIMFGKKFRSDPARAAVRDEWRRRIIANSRIGVTRAVKGVIDRQGVYDELDRIELPTLILAGDRDVATVLAKSERIQARIAGSRLVVIPGAGHLSPIEEPQAVNAELARFLSSP